MAESPAPSNTGDAGGGLAGVFDIKSWPPWAQLLGYIASLVLAAWLPNAFKDDKPKGETYTKAEVRAMMDTAVNNTRYAHQRDIDDIYTWTLQSLDKNGLEPALAPQSFRPRGTPYDPPPSYPADTTPVTPPPREVHKAKAPP